MGRGRSVVGGQLLPFPDSASSRTAAGVGIPNGSDVEVGSVQIPGGNVGKIVIFSMEVVDSAGGESVQLKFLRGGAEVEVTDRYQALTSLGRLLMTTHWRDDTPGVGQITYSVTATASIGGQSTAQNRRITVFHG